MLILRGGTILPVDSGEIAAGAVAVEGDKIVGCGSYREIRQEFPPFAEIDLSDCAILPGLVNAHTHLELSDLQGKVPYGGDFVDWVRRLTALRSKSVDALAQTIRQACKNSLVNGVTTVGDICYGHRAWPILVGVGIRKVCFAEVFGQDNNLDVARQYLEQCIAQTQCDDLLRLGLSPHAPYSAEAGLYKLAGELAGQNSLALTTHLAETLAEQEFLTAGTGPWVEHLKHIGKWDGSYVWPGETAVRYFLQLDLGDQAFLLAHVNYLTDDEMAELAGTKHSVAYCPRSHRFFEHQRHHFAQMLEMGINVCLGTDSLASNDTLSILDEMRFIHRQYPEFPAEALLRMATINGARALGWDDKIGTIAGGKYADLVAVPVTGSCSDVLIDLLESGAEAKMTMVAGKIIYQAD